MRISMLGLPGDRDPEYQECFVHDLRGRISVRELGSAVFGPPPFDEGGESLESVVRTERGFETVQF